MLGVEIAIVASVWAFSGLVLYLIYEQVPPGA
jgi:hypothetical protein